MLDNRKLDVKDIKSINWRIKGTNNSFKKKTILLEKEKTILLEKEKNLSLKY